MLLGGAFVEATREGGVAGLSFSASLALDGTAKLAALAATLFVARRFWSRAQGSAAPPGPAALAGALTGLAFLPLMVGVGLLQGWIYSLVDFPVRAQTIVSEAVSGPVSSFAALAVFAVTVAPVSEEVLFRGFLYAGLRTRLGRVASAVATAGAFCLIHVVPDAFATTFLLGLVLADLRERTGGLTAPIAAHACYNAFSMAGIWMARQGG